MEDKDHHDSCYSAYGKVDIEAPLVCQLPVVIDKEVGIKHTSAMKPNQ
jgi:hypothetical protein